MRDTHSKTILAVQYLSACEGRLLPGFKYRSVLSDGTSRFLFLHVAGEAGQYPPGATGHVEDKTHEQAGSSALCERRPRSVHRYGHSENT